MVPEELMDRVRDKVNIIKSLCPHIDMHYIYCDDSKIYSLESLCNDICKLFEEVAAEASAMKWITRNETHGKPFDTLYLAYQAGYPLKVVRFITGQGMVDVRTGESCEPTRFLEIKLPDDLK